MRSLTWRQVIRRVTNPPYCSFGAQGAIQTNPFVNSYIRKFVYFRRRVYETLSHFAGGVTAGGAGQPNGAGQQRPRRGQGDARHPRRRAVNILLDGRPFCGPVEDGQTTAYTRVDSGKHNHKVIAADPSLTLLADTEVEFDSVKPHTIILAGLPVGPVQVMVVHDFTEAPPPNYAKLRVVHASVDAPAVDVATAGHALLLPNVPFTGITDFKPVECGGLYLEFSPVNTTDPILEIPWLDLPAGSVTTVVITGLYNEPPGLSTTIFTDRRGGVRSAPQFRLPMLPSPAPCCGPSYPPYSGNPGYNYGPPYRWHSYPQQYQVDYPFWR